MSFWRKAAWPAFQAEGRKLHTWVEIALAIAAVAALFGYDKIPASYRARGFVVLGAAILILCICRLLAFWRRAEIDREALAAERDGLREQLQHARMNAKESLRIIEIEGFPINTLMQFVAHRSDRPCNDVRLELYAIHLKLKGHHQHKDVVVTYRITGVNTAHTPLACFHLTICGEGQPQIEDLRPMLYELKRDPDRKWGKMPLLRKGNGGCKEIMLPFEAPGVPPGGEFDIEFTYTWPSTFKLPSDYWFLDNANCAKPARRVRLALEFEEPHRASGNVYKFEPDNLNAALIGAVSVNPVSGTMLCYETDTPSAEMFYLLIVTAHPDTSARAALPSHKSDMACAPLVQSDEIALP